MLKAVVASLQITPLLHHPSYPGTMRMRREKEGLLPWRGTHLAAVPYFGYHVGLEEEKGEQEERGWRDEDAFDRGNLSSLERNLRNVAANTEVVRFRPPAAYERCSCQTRP